MIQCDTIGYVMGHFCLIQVSFDFFQNSEKSRKMCQSLECQSLGDDGNCAGERIWNDSQSIH